MYWSADHSTFLPANDQDQGGKKKAEQDSKKDKVKTAKRIAKDMEKWAKTLNQKKEKAQSAMVAAASPAPAEVTAAAAAAASRAKAARSGAGAEDIAFSMLNKRLSSAGDDGSGGLADLAGYGSDSEEDNNASAAATGPSRLESVAAPDESQLTDWGKMACLLCKRQFPSKEKLQK